jgi:hypothetical protein
MKRSSGPRKTASNLSESIHQQLNMYAIAAGAAGVGMVALAQPAEARIIYTKANVVIGINKHYNLDLNHDGIKDFTIQNSYSRRRSCTYRNGFFEVPRTGNDVEGKTPWAKELFLGSLIGHSQSFFEGTRGNLCGWASFRRFGQCHRLVLEPWCNGATRYLGVAFQIHGRTHYGWARLSVSRSKTTLTGYAYETIAGKLIKAGQTKSAQDEPILNPDDFGPGASLTNPVPDKPQHASLDMLALGAQGVPLWRRKESALEGDSKRSSL